MRSRGTAAVLVALTLLLAGAASGGHVEPVLVPGTTTCAQLVPGTTELRIEPVADGTYTDGTLTVTIDVRETAAGQVADFRTNLGVDAVAARGGPNTNVYLYGPEAVEDTGVHAPVDPSSGTNFPLQHLTFCYDIEPPPTVTIDQAATQQDPTSESPIHFTAVFSAPVTGFETGDVVLAGTAGATTAIVTEIAPNDGTTYDVAVSGMTASGTVTASIPAAVATAGFQPNAPSTSTDNTVTFLLPLRPGGLGFWKNWRNHYTSPQVQALVDHLKADNSRVYDRDLVEGTADDLTLAKLDAILDVGRKPPREQLILAQLTTLKLNLAITQLDGTAGLVQHNDDLCSAGVADVSTVDGATAFFGTSTPTVGQVATALEVRWTGSLTASRSDWRFNLTDAQQAMVVDVLTGVNEGTLLLSSGCA